MHRHSPEATVRSPDLPTDASLVRGRRSRAMRWARLSAGLALLCLPGLAACRAEVLTGPLPLGPWGGPQGTLTIYADSATLDLPCAAGRIPAMVSPSGDGAFEVAGSYAIQAGPVSIDGPVWRPATYSGHREGDRIQLFIALDGTTTIGPFTFERGVVKMFPRCL